MEDLFKNGIIKKEKKVYSKILRIDFEKDRVISAKIYDIHQSPVFNDTLKTEVKANQLSKIEQMQKNFTQINSTKKD